MKKIKKFKNKCKIRINDLEEYEKFIGHKLPEDYKEFLLKNNGICLNQYYGFPLIEPIYDNPKIGSNAALDYMYPLNDDSRFFNLYASYKMNTKYEIPEEFIIIGNDAGESDICFGFRGEYYGMLYFKASDNYMYKIANNFTDFINSLYAIEIKNINEEWYIKRIHDKYSLPFSTEVKKYGDDVKLFFDKAPKEVVEYFFLEKEKTGDLLLYYIVESEKKKYCREIKDGKVVRDYVEDFIDES